MLIPLPQSLWSSALTALRASLAPSFLLFPSTPHVGSHYPRLLQSWTHSLSNLKGSLRPHCLLCLGITQFPGTNPSAFSPKHQFPFLSSHACSDTHQHLGAETVSKTHYNEIVENQRIKNSKAGEKRFEPTKEPSVDYQISQQKPYRPGES